MASNDKYDRQVRLWGGHGQRALCESHIIMLGSASSGTETLKNLVLPAIGSFKIVDDAVVTERDFGNDWFVTRDDLYKPKAQVVADMMCEMNPDVKGMAELKSVDDFIKENVQELEDCQLIIATDINNEQAMKLSDIAERKNKPLCVLRQYGMLGYLRVFKQENMIIESKTTQDVHKRDLRMADPWPELLEYANSFKFEELAVVDHIHVPYAVILIQAANMWRAEHDGKLPKTFAEKGQFKDMIKKMNKHNGENFEEAINMAWDLWKEDMPYHLQAIMDDPKSQSSSETFWLFVAALKQFQSEHKRLPVSGVVPDMISTSASYLGIQQLYIKRAQEDRNLMAAMLQAIMKQRNIEREIDENMWLLFCKNLKQLQVSRMRSIAQEIQDPQWSTDVGAEYWDQENCTRWFIVMKAFEELRMQGEDLGANFDKQDEETAKMRVVCDKITGSINEQPVADKYIREILRFGTSKLHNISAYLGGVAAQECIKLLISQFMPINHSFVYDGIHGRGQCFNL